MYYDSLRAQHNKSHPILGSYDEGQLLLSKAAASTYAPNTQRPTVMRLAGGFPVVFIPTWLLPPDCSYFIAQKQRYYESITMIIDALLIVLAALQMQEIYWKGQISLGDVWMKVDC